MTSSTISDLTACAAAQFGERAAIFIDGGAVATFTEIDSRAARFAGGLAALGVGQGDRVVIYLPNSIEWVVAYHAVAKLGAVVVPANILLSAAEVGFIAADSEAKVVLCDRSRLEAVISCIPELSRPLLIAPLADHDEMSFERVAAGSALKCCDVAPDDLFTIGYTSGTTGKPKGAMMSHRAVYDSTAMTATIHVRHSGDRVLSALPLPHVYGNVVLNAAFMAGYELHVMPRFDAARALELIETKRITLLEGVPTMYYQLLQLPELKEGAGGSLTRCTVGGQTMPTAYLSEVEQKFGCPLLELWGMTEVAGPATSHSPYWGPRHGSIGLPFPGTEVRIVALDDANAVAAVAVAGELQVRGPQVTQGYWNNSEATAAAFDVDGWFSTGDIATRDADGYLRIVDRRKDMIITAGYNVYPAELEQVIAMHPSVAMVAVAAIPDAAKGELAKAFIVLRPGQQCSEDEILVHCRNLLAAYKVPRAVAFVDDLPRTSTGKIMRRALSARV
jgi:long-chain acyl-CoA synthetase